MLGGGQAGVEDPPGTALALSRSCFPSNNLGMVVPSLKPEALEGHGEPSPYLPGLEKVTLDYPPGLNHV